MINQKLININIYIFIVSIYFRHVVCVVNENDETTTLIRRKLPANAYVNINTYLDSTCSTTYVAAISYPINYCAVDSGDSNRSYKYLEGTYLGQTAYYLAYYTGSSCGGLPTPHSLGYQLYNNCTQVGSAYQMSIPSASLPTYPPSGSAIAGYAYSDTACVTYPKVIKWSSTACIPIGGGDYTSQTCTAGSAITIFTYTTNTCNSNAQSPYSINVDCDNGVFTLISGNTVSYKISSYCTSEITSRPTFLPTLSPTFLPIIIKKKACFSANETVQLSSGEKKLISQVHIGDSILSMNRFGQYQYAEVIALPHPVDNIDKATFVEVSMKSGKRIYMTIDHIIPVLRMQEEDITQSCTINSEETIESNNRLPSINSSLHTYIDLNSRLSNSLYFNHMMLIAASELQLGDRIYTIHGLDTIIHIDIQIKSGIYTVITTNEYIIVNDIVVSPYGTNHQLAHFLYEGYRSIYYILPNSLKNSPNYQQSTTYLLHTLNSII